MPCTRHRVFLAILIVAAKYLNDSSPKTKHWTRYAILFDNTEVNLMEMQLLTLLDFDLRFTEDDAIEQFSAFMPHRISSPKEDKETRRSAVRRIKAHRSRSLVNVQDAQMPITPPPDVVHTTVSHSKSSSGHLDVPTCGSRPVALPRSPVSAGSSPLAMSRSITVGSDASMDALTDDNGTSGSEVEDSEDDNVITIPSWSSSSSRISFTLPPKPPQAKRNTNRCSSYAKTTSPVIQVDSRSGMQVNTMSSVSSIRESVSSGFLSRMFGTGQKDKSDRRTEKEKSNTDTATMPGAGDVLIASASSSGLNQKGIRSTSQLFRSQRYSCYDNDVDIIPV